MKKIFRTINEDVMYYSEEVRLTPKQRRDLNAIVRKYNGWKYPREISKMWDELEEYGIDIGMISGYPNNVAEDGAKSWSKSFLFNGKLVKNSTFIYSFYEGNEGLKNEYLIYFS